MNYLLHISVEKDKMLPLIVALNGRGKVRLTVFHRVDNNYNFRETAYEDTNLFDWLVCAH